MKIKNTKELKLRARSHAKNDHVKQRTYGIASTNGKTEYQGCAVSCLATPHRLKDLRAYIIENGEGEEDGIFYAEFEGKDQRAKVTKEFGITAKLMIAGEGFFESQKYHGAAIEFVKNFACSLQEGADITPKMVESWCEDNLQMASILSFDSFTYRFTGYDALPIETKTQDFLKWLRSIK